MHRLAATVGKTAAAFAFSVGAAAPAFAVSTGDARGWLDTRFAGTAATAFADVRNPIRVVTAAQLVKTTEPPGFIITVR